MKNLYGNRLKKNQKIFQENIEEKTKKLFALKHYVNNGKKLNTYSGYNITEIKKGDTNTNSLINSYNENYNSKKKFNYKINNRCNNHSLYDSNQQKIINSENTHNFIKYVSNNHSCSKNYNQINSINMPLCTLRNFESRNIKPNYIDEYHKKTKYEDKYEKKINNIKNYSRKNERNANSFCKNYLDASNHKIIYTNNNSGIKDKSLDLCKCCKCRYKCNCTLKYPLVNRNQFYKIRNNHTEINSNYYDKSPSQRETRNKKRESYNLKRNMTDKIYLTEKNSQEKNIKDFMNSNFIKKCEKVKEVRPPSYFMNKNYNTPDNDNKRNINSLLDKNINKTTKNINEDKLKSIIPIKLNIEYTNKEKLSKLKKIIENSSKNHNFYQLDLNKNLKNNIVKSTDRNKNIKKEKENKNKNNIIFKKKKINIILKDENKEKDVNNIYYGNNILVTSPINKKKVFKSNLLVNNNKIKDNNQIQSLVASYNLYINKENNKLHKSNENKLSSKETEQTSYNKESITFKKKKPYKKKIIDCINNDDTISLNYSKESLSSKNKKNDNINICLPFLLEQFSILYNKYNKKLIIDKKNDENKKTKNNFTNIDSDDDDYQLTKEIILLKKGLAKKSELSSEMKKKLREIKLERVYKLSLFGNRRIYKKKTDNYKNYVS